MKSPETHLLDAIVEDLTSKGPFGGLTAETRYHEIDEYVEEFSDLLKERLDIEKENMFDAEQDSINESEHGAGRV